MRADIQEIVDSKNRSEWETLIGEWIHNEQVRAMLKRYLLDGIPYEPLAEEFNLSTVRTGEIIRKAENQLFKHI